MMRRRICLAYCLASAFVLTAVRTVGAREFVRFLLMSDTHVESDFAENGREVYTMWKPAHSNLIETYRFISSDPVCSDVDFALFLGDQLNTGYTRCPRECADELGIYRSTLSALAIVGRTPTAKR